jgi:hypothetical protein
MVLNHKVQGVAAVYDRHEGDGKKRRALLAWDREVARIVSGAPAAERSFQFDKESGHTIEDETVAPDRCDAGGLVFDGSSD